MLDFLQCDVDLSVPVKNLRTAEQQIIQLTKALLNEPKVLILDELTAVLQEKMCIRDRGYGFAALGLIAFLISKRHGLRNRPAQQSPKDV